MIQNVASLSFTYCLHQFHIHNVVLHRTTIVFGNSCHFLYERILTNKVVIYLCAKALFQTNVKSRFKTNIANAVAPVKPTISYEVFTQAQCGKMRNLLSRHLKIRYAQCRTFKIFVSLRFYVKPILWILDVQKLPFLPFQGLWILFIW